MQEFLTTLLTAVITAAIPIITAFAVKLIKNAADSAEANADSVTVQTYIAEISSAITAAVSATSQTYVDALKSAGSFTKEAQTEALQKSLTACIAALSPAVQSFIEDVYGDITEYLTTKIEAEVRAQKLAINVTTE
ncbi:MAG: hypothetical protein LUH03_11105 [Oscillospiraceae bacterium]|nr:hypothetical protein [Oscillospiraceae bacterium]